MAKYNKKDLEKLNKDYKKTFKTSGCRLLSDTEMENINDSLSLLSSSDVKIIEAAKNGNYSNFNDVSPLIRNYIGTLAISKMTSSLGISKDEISLDNPQVKKYVEGHVLDAGFRVGLTALKHTYPNISKFKEVDTYSNEYMLAKTLSAPSQERINSLNQHIGSTKTNQELQKNLAKQVVLAKTLFLAQLGQYNLKENDEVSEYKGSIAETFAHGGRTNFILPFNDVNNLVLNAFDGGNIAKTAEFKSRLAATHSATLRKVGVDLSIESESKEEKPNFSQVGKIFSNQYGMNIGIGGIGEIGPNQKPILADGSSGHMYIRKQQGNETTCGSIMIGIESAASLKTSHTGHFHTPLAKSSKQSAFLSDKFGPGDKINSKTVDLSGLDCNKLADCLQQFETGYMALQNSKDHESLNKVNAMLSGKRLEESELLSLMTNSLGMQKDFASELVSGARKGLEGRVQAEQENLDNQFKDVFGVGLNNSAKDSFKIMHKGQNGKWELANLFSAEDTPSQMFGKFWRSVKSGEQLYFSSNTKLNPTKIAVAGKQLISGADIEKQNIAEPKEPSSFKKSLYKISNGLFFSSTMKQFEKSKEAFEKSQAINTFIDENKIVVEQNLISLHRQEDQSYFRKKLAEVLENRNTEKSSQIDSSTVKAERSIQF